ncbi:hypothetical protein Hanom_Chr04g00330801 [Helianthus anomalus]
MECHGYMGSFSRLALKVCTPKHLIYASFAFVFGFNLDVCQKHGSNEPTARITQSNISKR